MLNAQNYAAAAVTVDGIQVVRLTDQAAGVEVSIAPSIGNNAFDMKVKGRAVFWSPYKSVGEFHAKPALLGNPFLAPWANRLDSEGFWANGHRYRLNPDIKNYRRDGHQQPIHGLVSITPAWKVVATGADESGAWVTSRLEFWRRPEWMAQFPFAHTIDMTYRLSGGVLEVRTKVENHAVEPMPLVIGYHPYFALPGTARDDWRVHLAAKEHVTLSDRLVPTGERTPVTAQDIELRGRQLDDVYTNLDRDGRGRAEFRVEAGGKRVTVVFGPKYTVAVVYAPPGRDFICFEPMTGVTNGFNLAHEGKFREMQSVPAGGVWEESYWVSAQ